MAVCENTTPFLGPSINFFWIGNVNGPTTIQWREFPDFFTCKHVFNSITNAKHSLILNEHNRYQLGLDPLGFLGFPSLVDDIFFHLIALTAYISQRVTCFIEDVVLQDVYTGLGDSLADGFVRQPGILIQSILRSFLEECADFVNSYVANTSYGTCLTRSLDLNGECLVNTTSQFIEPSCKLGASLIFKGLVLPFSSLRLSWRLTTACWRCTFCVMKCTYAQVCSFASRLQKTLRGSSDDIGWLQLAPGMAPVVDGTVRFSELLEDIGTGEHKLPDSFVYLLIPGLFSNHGPLYFVATKKFFSKMGLACHIAKIHSEASVEHNAMELKQYIEELFWGSGKPVMLLGHSKGGVDAAAALSLYWPDLQDKVAGLALVQSPYGGTPIASDILREGQIADKETRRIMELVICKLIKGDIRALEDLTYEKRKEFILKHRLPDDIPVISFHSEANIAPGVLATMTHIAHAELPWLPLPMFGCDESETVVQSGRKVPVIMPVSAAMAVSALHLQLRYGEKSDGLVTCRDAEVPGSVVVRPHRKLDHAWMVYSTRNRDPNEPEACEMCEALLTMLVELGKKRKEQREKLDFSKLQSSSSLNSL